MNDGDRGGSGRPQDSPPGPPGGGSAPDTSARTSLPSRTSTGLPGRIGQYTIRRIIASGGMGTVYEAVQEKPRRSVAVKVMKHGVTSASALRRFEYEAQLLARLSHPGIAQIHEAGTHEGPEGTVPFFAMEYIPNARPLTVYADEQKLGIRERLELLARACDAVHHGHTKGIIHRDLKPGNIMVDSAGQPKIIDFGVARATDSDLVMPTLQTSVGDLVGTLQYMSPEQCEADPHDIDTRSDVYSLGIILYELLTGRLPYDVTRSPVHEAARIVRESQPVDPSSIRKGLPRDVRTIAAKAMEKPRERRYQSALGLAQDIRRYLDGEAIEARPPSLAYQLAVFARRNRAAVGAALAFVAALAIGLGISTWLFVQARRAEAQAEAERESAVAALSFMEEMISSADPVRIGDRVKVGDLLDRYGELVHEAFADQPLTEARVRVSLGKTYQHLYFFETILKGEEYRESARMNLAEAFRLRQENLGEESSETLESMSDLIDVLSSQGRLDEAERLARRALAIRQRMHGKDHPETLAAMDRLATVLIEQKRYDEAEPLAAEALQTCESTLGPETEQTLEPLWSMAELRLGQGKVEEGERILRDLLARSSAVHGEEAKVTRRVRGRLGGLLMEQGRIDEAAAIFGNKPVPDSFGIQTWLQGEADLRGQDPTVILFWESWCPFSQKQVPEFDLTSRPYQERGLEVVSFARADEVEDEVDRLMSFVHDKGMTIPTARTSTEPWRYFGIPGTPSAAVLKDGRVVYQGYLRNVTGAFLDSLMR